MTSVMPVKEKKQFTDAELAALNKRLIKARTSLVLEHPFIGTIALNMPMEFNDEIKTARTDGKRVQYSPHFIEGLTDEEVKFLVAHECFHPMLEHNYRRGERSPKRWNQAGDYIINKLLIDDGIGKMIHGGLHNPQLVQQAQGTTDGVYNLLPETDDDDYDDGIGEDIEDGGNSPAEAAQQAAEWKVKVAQAAQAAKMMGKLSANQQRLVDEVLNPKVNWCDVTRRFLTRCKADTRSFARPNRRFASQGLYMPSRSGERLGEVAFHIDCSGSIGQKELNQFATEIKWVKDNLNPSVIHVLYFDNEVCHYDKFTANEEVVISPHGGGGTAFSPCFQYLRDHDINPVASIFLTDLYCNDFGDEPDHPVLWVSNGTDEAPFGEVVMM